MKLFSALILLLLSQQLMSQSLRFNRVLGHGKFDNSSITAIDEDYLGRMWFGSREGLHLYDATSIRSFYSEMGNDNSLTTNWIQCIKTNRDKSIWIGTDNGLNRMSLIDFSVKRYNLSVYGSRENSVIDLYIDDSQVVWVSTFGGLFRYDASLDEFIKIEINSGVNSLVISNFYKNNNGQVLLVTINSGLYTLNTNAGVITPYEVEKLAGYEIRNVTQDTHGNYWIATKNDGLLLYDGYSIRQNNQGDDAQNILQVYADESGVYALTDGDGLYVVQPESFGITKYRVGDGSGVNSNVVMSVFKDSRNTLWFGMINAGVCYLDQYSSVFKHFLNQKSNESFEKTLSILDAIAIDDNNLLVSTDGEGLINLNLTTGKTTQYIFNDIRVIKSLFKDSKGYIWGGTYQNGLICLNNELKLMNHYPEIKSEDGILNDDSVWAINEDSEGRLWIGTLGSGLFLLDRINRKFYSCKLDLPDFKLDESVITTIFIDDNGDLFVGTKEGLLLYSETEKQFIPFEQIATALSNNTIRQLYRDTQNGLWICTEDGLNYWKDKRHKVFSPNNGLSANRIQGIAEDNAGRLWIASTYGLNMALDSSQFRTFLVEDGLSSNNINTEGVFKLPDNRIVLLTLNGITLFNPNQIKTNTIEPEIVFSDLWINGELKKKTPAKKNSQHISNVNQLNFKYQERFFSIAFSALNYNWPGKNKYSYKLEGYNDNWIDAGNMGRATYTNLSPGEYTFKVKASNNDGLWSKEAKELAIVVHRPWWDTWWANLIYFSCLVGLIYFFRSYIVKGEIYKHTILSKELEVKRKEDLEKLKDQFFTNISHDIRTPLSLILAPITSLMSNDNSLSSGERISMYQTIKKNCDSLLRLVNQLLDYRKLELGILKLRVQEIDLNELLNGMVRRFSTSTYSNQNYSIHFKATENVKLWGDYIMIENVFYNLISNAVKHANKEDIEIELGCKIADDKAILWVSDNGQGINESTLKRIFERFYQGNQQGTGNGIGLAYVKELVNLHKATIKVESSSEWGTRFEMEWLLGNEHFDKSLLKDKRKTATDTDSNIETLRVEDEGENTDANKLPKLIIAEDNDDLRQYLYNEFKSSYRVKLAANGSEALKIVESFFPDLIISDVMMPEMDGNQLCQKVKTKISTSHIPVILLTAKTTDENQMEGIESGADAYITKPFNVELLKSKVNKTIEIRQQLRKRFSQLPEADPKELDMSDTDKKLLSKLNEFIEKNIQESDLSIESTAEELGLSRGHLHKKMKALTGVSPSEYIRNIRLKKAADLLRLRKYTIEEITYEVGFSSPSYFSRSFNHYYGTSPSKFINQD
jgi:signal transduction histidine kinase/ligand-binding sensor domain-containing protein/DNA-binding response OmpR family regulator